MGGEVRGLEQVDMWALKMVQSWIVEVLMVVGTAGNVRSGHSHSNACLISFEEIIRRRRMSTGL